MTDFRIADPLLRRLVYAMGVMGVLSFGLYTFGLFKGAVGFLLTVLSPFLTSLLLAYLFSPVVGALQKRLRLGRIMGTLVLFLLLIFGVFLVLAFIVPNLIHEVVLLIESLRTGIPALVNRISKLEFLRVNPAVIETLRQKLLAVEFSYEQVVDSLLPFLRKMAAGGFQAVGGAARGFFSGVGMVTGFVSSVVLVGILTFYFVVDWDRIPPLVRRMVPPERRDRFFDVLEKIDTAVGGFLRGQITVSAIVGGLFAVGLFSIGLMGFPTLRNYCILIGTVAGIAGFIPYLGAVMGVTPAILIVLFTEGVAWGPKAVTLLGVLGLFALIQALEGFVLQPRIVGKGAGLHPLLVMLALIAGAQFGIGGMVAAVPLACVARVLVREFYWLPLERRDALLTAPEE